MLIPLSEILQTHNLKPKGVLHVGAWDGIELEDYLACGIENVAFIEANEEILTTLRGRVNGNPNISVIHACISDKEEQVELKITNNGQSTSILEFGTHASEHPEVVVERRVKMKTTTLLDVMYSHVLYHDFLNIDIQGAELKALKGAGHYITQFKAIYCEVNSKHLYLDCPLIGEVDDYLKQYGFTRMDTKFTKHGWGDALYLCA